MPRNPHRRMFHLALEREDRAKLQAITDYDVYSENASCKLRKLIREEYDNVIKEVEKREKKRRRELW